MLFFCGSYKTASGGDKHYHQDLDTPEDRPSPLPAVSESEMLLFLTYHTNGTLHTRQMDYWARMEEFYMPFYSNTMKPDKFLHNLHFLHFIHNRNEIDRNNEKIVGTPKVHYAKLYIPSDDLAMDKIIVLFKERVAFRQFIPRKGHIFWHQSFQII
jgi:hypothetical protein